MTDAYPYRYAWGNNPVRAQLKGLPCRIVCRGSLNSVMLEFADGRRVVTSGNAIRRRRVVDEAAASEAAHWRAPGLDKAAAKRPAGTAQNPAWRGRAAGAQNRGGGGGRAVA